MKILLFLSVALLASHSHADIKCPNLNDISIRTEFFNKINEEYTEYDYLSQINIFLEFKEKIWLIPRYTGHHLYQTLSQSDGTITLMSTTEYQPEGEANHYILCRYVSTFASLAEFDVIHPLK
jgi:hypothetical protein